jgi:hypothetical protein
MAKLGEFKTPTGATGNLLNPMDWLSLVLGAIVLIITFAMGQNFASKLGGKIPGIDSTIEQPWKSDIPAVTSNKNSRVVL